jgi:hypothetical protein
MVLLAAISTSIFAQSNNHSSERILKQKSYNIDLPTYKKAKLIVDRLLSEIKLSEQEIIEVLDEMVLDSTPVENQILIRFHNLPVFIDTGNPKMDHQKYNEAKEKWIQSNPEKHQKLMNSNNVQK